MHFHFYTDHAKTRTGSFKFLYKYLNIREEVLTLQSKAAKP